MGRISKGILGGFSGTVGTVVGGSWKGIDYMRSQSARRTGSFTQAQLEQQAKFALMIRFLRSMMGLLMISFRNYAVKMTGYNNAVSYNLKNAITGTYPNYSIDYGQVLISRGDLPNVLAPIVTAAASSGVKFDWTNNAGVGKAKPEDKVILVIYSPTQNAAIYTTGSNERSSGTETINAASFSGEEVQTYIGVISQDGKDFANSIYTGTVTVS